MANFGKSPGLDEDQRRGWEDIANMLDGRPSAAIQGKLGERFPKPAALWTQVDVRGLRVERVLEFGEIYLALSLWRRLGLQTLLRELMEVGREAVPWELAACFLTLAMWRTLEMWMRGKGLGDCARQLLKEVAAVRSMDVVLPVKAEESAEATELRLRVVARPDRMVAELLHRLGLELPSAPKTVQNVVPKIGL